MAQRNVHGARLVLGGKAVVCCVHDRLKREITTEQQVVELGADLGIVLDKAHHHIHHCPCCDNLFVADGITERYCSVCTRPLVHALGGPLPEPKGAID